VCGINANDLSPLLCSPRAFREYMVSNLLSAGKTGSSGSSGLAGLSSRSNSNLTGRYAACDNLYDAVLRSVLCYQTSEQWPYLAVLCCVVHCNLDPTVAPKLSTQQVVIPVRL
jgi:hypothetical protein